MKLVHQKPDFRTSESASTQVQSEVANMCQNMKLQLEHVEAMLFSQNMILQHMEAMFNAPVRRFPFSIWRLRF